MELFIQVRDGAPFEHPIFEENFRAAFPDIDVTNLPPNFARFTRVECPILGAYEIYEGVTYEQVANGFSDVHHIRQMTDDEKLEKQNSVKSQWAEFGYPSWVFNEVDCKFDAPIPRPQDDKRYYWDEESQSWIES